MDQKSPDAFRTISEVAEWLGVPTHVLRFWESRFSQVKPVKRAGGRRYYRPADMELLGGIRKLLHEDGMTIRGVQKLLREEGIKYVAALSPSIDGDIPDGDGMRDVTPSNVVPMSTREPEPPLETAPEPNSTPEPTPDPETTAMDFGEESADVNVAPTADKTSEDFPEAAMEIDAPQPDIAPELIDLQAASNVEPAPDIEAETVASPAATAPPVEPETPAPVDAAMPATDPKPEPTAHEPLENSAPEIVPSQAVEDTLNGAAAPAIPDPVQPDPALADSVREAAPADAPEHAPTPEILAPDAPAQPAPEDVPSEAPSEVEIAAQAAPTPQAEPTLEPAPEPEPETAPTPARPVIVMPDIPNDPSDEGITVPTPIAARLRTLTLTQSPPSPAHLRALSDRLEALRAAKPQGGVEHGQL